MLHTGKALIPANVMVKKKYFHHVSEANYKPANNARTNRWKLTSYVTEKEKKFHRVCTSQRIVLMQLSSRITNQRKQACLIS